MLTLFGIKNCDTVKKAKKWLQSNQIDYRFHDYRVDGLDQAWLVEACQALGWENVLNKRGTTFRQLNDEQKADLDEQKAINLMMQAPAMIKRPILVDKNQFFIGFKPQQYQEIFD